MKQIHQIWFGNEMPEQLREMTNGVREMHSTWPWSYIAWDDRLLWTVFALDTEKLLAEWGSWASVSNYARLLILEKFGGAYLDCDFICHKPLHLILTGSAGGAMQDGGRLCNAFMYSEPRHPWILRQLAKAASYKGYGAEWGVLAATETLDKDVVITPSHLVYPWLYDAPVESRKPHPESVLEHAWKKGW